MAKADLSRPSDELLSPPTSTRISSNPDPPSITSNQLLSIFMSQNEAVNATCGLNKNHSFSLLEIDDLENRVVCVDRKLRVAGFRHAPEVLNSYHVIPLEKMKHLQQRCSFFCADEKN